jgi:hypothetical protein
MTRIKEHARLLTGYTTLADGEAFEWAKAKGGKFTRHAWHDLMDLVTQVEQAVTNGFDTYVGLAVRRCPKGGAVGRCGCRTPFDRGHVARMLAAAADLDVKAPPRGFPSKTIARDALKTARLLASFVVDSGGGIQPYWLYEEPVTDLAAFTAGQRGIAKHFGSDPIVDPCRVMRLAGTYNFKSEAPRPTDIIAIGFSPDGEDQAQWDPRDTYLEIQRHTLSAVLEAFPHETAHEEEGDDDQAGEADDEGDVAAIRARLSSSALHLLDTPGNLGRYPSDSEADMACVSTLVRSGLHDGEVWCVLRPSARYRARVNRKGRRHAEALFGAEIRKVQEKHRERRRSDTPDAAEYVGGDDEPAAVEVTINTGEQDRETTETWTALCLANRPPKLFVYGDVPARIVTGDQGEPAIEPLNVDRLTYHLGKMVRLVQAVKNAVLPVWAPQKLVRNMLATPIMPLPALRRVTTAPIVATDGTIQTTPGYSEATRTYFQPAIGLHVPEVAPTPTDAELQRAKALLMDDLLGDFFFVADADRQHALGLLLLPFVRDLIEGPTPLHLIEKPTPGSGGTLLATVTALPAVGAIAGITEGKDEDEWRKRTTAHLLESPAIFLIDNVRLPLDSAALASAITCTLWRDRILGVSREAKIPVSCAWVATGNNPTLSDEIARRSVRIRLNPKVDQPWMLTGYKHGDLRGWAREHRGELVWAALTLARSWIVAGRPPGDRPLGMFEGWAATIGGVLQHHGYSAFLENAMDFYATADSEGAVWRAFVEAWWAHHRDTRIFASSLLDLAAEAGLDLGDGDFNRQARRLGTLLRYRRDRIIAACTITVAAPLHGKVQWRLVRPPLGAHGGVV